MALWLVRAGRYGSQEDFALDNGFAVIGWPELPDLAKVDSREDLRALMESTYPDAKAARIANMTGQVWAFLRRIEVGDIVALPLKNRPFVALGRVKGPYQHRDNNPEGARHTRPVEWLKEIPRTAFDQDLVFSLGAFMTVCQIQRNDAERRVLAILEGRAAPLPRSTVAPRADSDAEGAPDEEADLEAIARERLRQFINRKFKGHELTRLVDALLQADGYRTFVSPPGADRSVDIVAGRGGLGFDAPRIVVEVKSGDEPADSGMVTKLQGAMRRLSADHGLFVSWSGFKRSTDERELFFEIRLWDGDDLIEKLLENYDKLPKEIQTEIPLKRVWMLVPEE